MFALKIVLRAVQDTTVTYEYVTNVIVGDRGKNAMKLASRVAGDVLNGQNIDYLEKEDHSRSNVMFKSKKSFAVELLDYVRKQVDLLKLSDGRDQRRTRSNPFSVEDAQQISESYTESLWTAIKDRLQYTDLKESAAAYTEAPAEGVFSTYSRVSEGRPSATLGHLSALTRVAIHGPPPSTKDSHQLAEDALSHYKSKYGERFCTKMWFKGKTSETIKKQQQKKWNW